MGQDETRHEDRLQPRNCPMEVVVEKLHANGLSLGVRVVPSLLIPGKEEKTISVRCQSPPLVDLNVKSMVGSPTHLPHLTHLPWSII